MDHSVTSTRRRNGRSLGFSISDAEDGWQDFYNLSISVNRACTRWLEKNGHYSKNAFGDRKFSFGAKTEPKP